MRKIFYIAWKDVRIRIRDRKGLLLSIVMPLILIAILGMALSQVMDTQSNSLPKMKLAVYNGDRDTLSNNLVDQVLQSKELKPYITIVNESSPTATKKEVADGKVDAGITIPAAFTQNIMQAQSTQIEVLQDPGKQLVGQIVSSIVTSYTDRVQTVATSSQAVIKDFAARVSAPNTGSVKANDIGQISQQVIQEIQQRAMNPNSKIHDTSVGSNPISAIQYYSAAEAVMFLLFNATIGAKSFLQERSTETLARLYVTPTRRSDVLLGKFLGTFLFSTLQFIILLTGSRILFGVSWGSQQLQTIVIGIAYAIAVSGLSMLVAALVDDDQSADLVSNIGIYLLSALGGSMMPLYLFPDLMRNIAHIAPNTWALTSFLDIMTGTTWSALAIPICVLLGIGIAALSFGTLRLRMRLGGR